MIFFFGLPLAVNLLLVIAALCEEFLEVLARSAKVLVLPSCGRKEKGHFLTQAYKRTCVESQTWPSYVSTGHEILRSLVSVSL